jgi:hypothetical protein
MRHYIYFVQESSSGRLYIGSRTCNGSPEEDPYLGSFHDSSFKPDVKWVWAEFPTRKEANVAEETLHRLFDVVKSLTFVNRRIGSGAWSSGPLTWWTNGTSETLSEHPPLGWHKGRKTGVGQNVENRGRPWLYKSGHSQESREKMSKAHLGKVLSTKHKENLSKLTKGRRWACNKLGESIRLWPDEPLPPGFQWGRKYQDS